MEKKPILRLSTNGQEKGAAPIPTSISTPSTTALTTSFLPSPPTTPTPMATTSKTTTIDPEWDSIDETSLDIPDTISLAGDSSDTVLITTTLAATSSPIPIPNPPQQILQPPPYIENTTAAPLGSGIWSTVKLGSISSGTVVALKKGNNLGSTAVLASEARVLSYIQTALSSSPSTDATSIKQSFAEFYGYDDARTTLLLEYIPGMTLAEHYALLRSYHHKFGTPVVGTAAWLDLGVRLCEVFCWLKEKGVVHGDVKPHNILLRQGEGPVVIDFSSSHVIMPGARPEPISAVTEGFCAPELLNAFLPMRRGPVRTNGWNGVGTPPDSPVEEKPYPVPTFASDLFALATTMLCTAVGNDVYANAGRHAAIYARQGEPLEWVQRDDRILIAGAGTVVAKVLKGCFGKKAEGRVSVEALRERFREERAKLKI